MSLTRSFVLLLIVAFAICATSPGVSASSQTVHSAAAPAVSKALFEGFAGLFYPYSHPSLEWKNKPYDCAKIALQLSQQVLADLVGVSLPGVLGVAVALNKQSVHTLYWTFSGWDSAQTHPAASEYNPIEDRNSEAAKLGLNSWHKVTVADRVSRSDNARDDDELLENRLDRAAQWVLERKDGEFKRREGSIEEAKAKAANQEGAYWQAQINDVNEFLGMNMYRFVNREVIKDVGQKPGVCALAKLIVYLAVRPICVAEVVIRDSVLVNNDVGEETKYSYKKAAPQKAVVPSCGTCRWQIPNFMEPSSEFRKFVLRGSSRVGSLGFKQVTTKTASGFVIKATKGTEAALSAAAAPSSSSSSSSLPRVSVWEQRAAAAAAAAPPAAAAAVASSAPTNSMQPTKL